MSNPEEIVWQFAGEPNLSADGSTLYFVHHYYDAETGELHESDIFVTYRLDPERPRVSARAARPGCWLAGVGSAGLSPAAASF